MRFELAPEVPFPTLNKICQYNSLIVIAMLSSVLNSDQAIRVNIAIMRTFNALIYKFFCEACRDIAKSDARSLVKHKSELI
jgi:hypothetical protein